MSAVRPCSAWPEHDTGDSWRNVRNERNERNEFDRCSSSPSRPPRGALPSDRRRRLASGRSSGRSTSPSRPASTTSSFPSPSRSPRSQRRVVTRLPRRFAPVLPGQGCLLALTAAYELRKSGLTQEGLPTPPSRGTTAERLDLDVATGRSNHSGSPVRNEHETTCPLGCEGRPELGLLQLAGVTRDRRRQCGGSRPRPCPSCRRLSPAGRRSGCRP